MAVPRAAPRAAVTVAEWSVIGGIRHRRRADGYGAAAVHAARCWNPRLRNMPFSRRCFGARCPPVRLSRQARQARHRCAHRIARPHARRRRRDRSVARLRYDIGARWIEHRWRQRRRGGDILCLRQFGQRTGAKQDSAAARQKLHRSFPVQSVRSQSAREHDGVLRIGWDPNDQIQSSRAHRVRVTA